MTADLGLVPDAAQAQPGIVTAHTPGNGAGHRGLTNTGRASQAKDLTLDAAGEVLDGKELQNALLDLFQAVVILVQDDPGLFDVVVFLALFSPG